MRVCDLCGGEAVTTTKGDRPLDVCFDCWTNHSLQEAADLRQLAETLVVEHWGANRTDLLEMLRRVCDYITAGEDDTQLRQWVADPGTCEQGCVFHAAAAVRRVVVPFVEQWAAQVPSESLVPRAPCERQLS